MAIPTNSAARVPGSHQRMIIVPVLLACGLMALGGCSSTDSTDLTTVSGSTSSGNSSSSSSTSSTGGGSTSSSSSSGGSTADDVPTALTVTTLTLIGRTAPVSGHQVAVEVQGHPVHLSSESWQTTIPYDGSLTTVQVVKKVDGAVVSTRQVSLSAQ